MNGQQQIIRQVEIIHTSLLGLALICLVLLVGLLLPVLGFNALNSPQVAGVVVFVVLIGVGTLYYMNYLAHIIVQGQARLTDVLINSLGQGFLTFDVKGVCGPVYSQACHTLMMADTIAGRAIADILRVPEAACGEFNEWLDVLFMPDHALSFEDAARFLPDSLPRDDGRNVEITYRPVRDSDKRLVRIVLIATDKTEEKDAQKRADQERQFAAMICAIFAERQSFTLTIAEMQAMLDRLATFSPDLLEPEFFRTIHTLKGAALHFKMGRLGDVFHNLESTLRGARGRPESEIIEIVNQGRAEMQLEFGRVQNTLRGILGDQESYGRGLIEVEEESVYQFGRLLKQQNVSADIYFAYQNNILSVPLFSLLKTLDRQMLPLAEKLEKKVKPIQFRGDEVRVLARPLQHLLLALTHVVHNVVDHGIETPIARMAKGKDPQGHVVITVRRTKDTSNINRIEITIADDGAGIDPNRVRAKLMTADPEGSWRFDDDAAIVQRLLTMDISTKDEVSMLSGRGIGMSAVYQEVVSMGGTCVLRSVMHKGTELVISLPERMEADFN